MNQPSQSIYFVSRECKNAILEADQFFLHYVSRLLHKYDFADIGIRRNKREYDSEACAIIKNLPCCQTLDDLVEIVHESFIFWFDVEIVGSREKFRGVSAEIWAIWLHKMASG